MYKRFLLTTSVLVCIAVNSRAKDIEREEKRERHTKFLNELLKDAAKNGDTIIFSGGDVTIIPKDLDKHQ